jgi:protein phosphatase PTC2/3
MNRLRISNSDRSIDPLFPLAITRMKSHQASPLTVSSSFSSLLFPGSPLLPSISTTRLSHPLRQSSRKLASRNSFSLYPSTVSAKNYGKVKVFAANSCLSLAKHKNEDRVQILLNIKRPENLIQDKWPQSSFYGLYAGQGGKSCAEYLKENLHNAVFQDKNFPFRVKSALINGFEQTDAMFLSQAEEKNDFSGASALAVLIIGDKCFVANTGDTRAVLSSSFGAKFLQISTDHRPLDQNEYKRITENGAKVNCNYYFDNNGNKVNHGAYKVSPWNLTITRSLGNADAKIEKFGGNNRIIVPTPDVCGFKIKSEFDFLLMCSSAVFDKLSTKEAIECVWKGMRECDVDAKIETKVDCGVLELMNTALSLRCEGNLTVILIGFKNLVNAAATL